MMQEKFTRETELYPAVKKYFESLGFQVKSEVCGCDVVASKDETTIVVELKLTFNLKLVFQAINRQSLSENVYIALPDYALSKRKKRRREILLLMKKLEVGVISLARRPSGTTLEFLHTIPLQSDSGSESLSLEFEARHFDLNLGGQVAAKVVTAYRESAIALAVYLILHGTQRVIDIKKKTAIENAQSILSANHYQWFMRVTRGHYTVTAKCQQELTNYPQLTAFYRQLYQS